MSRRTDKVSSLMQKEIGRMLLELELPAMVTVSHVLVSPDMKYGKVLVTIFPSDEQTEKEILDRLHSSIRDMQAVLNKTFTMKFVPKISFAVDYSQDYADKINRLIDETKQ